MMGFSKGKALAWLKKNSIHYYGGKKFDPDKQKELTGK
jgi:hypothetical protein